MAIFCMGDTHGDITIWPLYEFNYDDGAQLTKDDYVIVCGDFGMLWNYEQTGVNVVGNEVDKCWMPEELWLLEEYEKFPWTTLWIDGNHENFNRLNTYPISEWHGGRVHKISDSVIHLMRGEIYNIDGYKIFTFGGAQSTDRGPAIGERYSAYKWWWPQELPSEEEKKRAHKNLEANGNKVDFIITHDCPAGINCGKGYRVSEVSNYLEMIRQSVDFTHWFCGHMHIDEDYGKLSILYHRILPIEYSVY